MSTEGPRVVTPALLRGWPLPDAGGDKHASGRLVLLGGSDRSPGAARLAAESALRVGTGKVTVATTGRAAAATAATVPEAAVVALATNAEGRIAPAAAGRVLEETATAGALLAGPGFVDPGDAVALLRAILPDCRIPLVLDALGSAYLTEHPEGLHHLEDRAVLTVNPTELAHTAGADEDEVARDPAGVAARVARRSRVVVLCGGTAKHVVTPGGRSWVVEGGGPGLGASGSGDVQAGLVAGLVARGAEPAQAAVWAGWLHARCGERLASSVGPLGYLARELAAQVPAVLAELA